MLQNLFQDMFQNLLQGLLQYLDLLKDLFQKPVPRPKNNKQIKQIYQPQEGIFWMI